MVYRGMIMAQHPSGIFELIIALHYLTAIVLAAGLLICIVITSAACCLNYRKIKRESQKENEDAEKK